MRRTYCLLGIALIAAACSAACWDVGSGEKIGMITRVAKTGLLCKTWEATLIRGGLNAGSGAFSQPFDFTVEGENADTQAAFLQDAMEKQIEVKIRYRAEAVTLCRSDSNDHFLVNVVELPKPPTGK